MVERTVTNRRPPHAKDLRKGRVSLPNHAYLLTTVVAQRKPVFNDFHAGRLLVHCLRRQHEAGLVESLAFVVMPDHLHWLVVLQPGADLSTLMRRVKGESSRRLGVHLFAGKELRSGRLWQDGFHDHVLRRDEDVRQVARYVVANPLRAGLVTHCGDYPLWDAKWVL